MYQNASPFDYFVLQILTPPSYNQGQFRFFDVFPTVFHRSTQIHSDPPRSTQIHSDPPRSTQIHPDPFRSTQIHPDPPRSTQIHPAPLRHIHPDPQIHPDPCRFIHIHPDPPHPDPPRSTLCMILGTRATCIYIYIYMYIFVRLCIGPDRNATGLLHSS